MGKTTASSCCRTVPSSSGTWQEKGIEFQLFSLPGSWVRAIPELDAESWPGDGDFRGGVARQSFSPHQTLNFSHSLYSRVWSLSVLTIPEPLAANHQQNLGFLILFLSIKGATRTFKSVKVEKTNSQKPWEEIVAPKTKIMEWGGGAQVWHGLFRFLSWKNSSMSWEKTLIFFLLFCNPLSSVTRYILLLHTLTAAERSESVPK